MGSLKCGHQDFFFFPEHSTFWCGYSVLTSGSSRFKMNPYSILCFQRGGFPPQSYNVLLLILSGYHLGKKIFIVRMIEILSFNT